MIKDNLIYNYIEKSVLRKIRSVNLLYQDAFLSIDKIANNLSCTINTVENDLSFFNEFLHLTIDKNNVGEYKIDPRKNIKKRFIYKKIYDGSLFLHCLKFFLTQKEKKKKFVEFIEEHYVSVSTGYIVKKNVEQYLKSIGLKIRNGEICGNFVTIRFLQAELYQQFGIQTILWQEEIVEKSNHVLNIVEDSLNIKFSASERNFYTSLMETSCSSKNEWINNTLMDFHTYTIDSYIYPQTYRTAVEQEFKDIWQDNFEIEYQFSVLSLMIVNSHVFDPSIDPEILSEYKNTFLNDPFINNFITIFNKEFHTAYHDELWLLSSLFILIKDATLHLDNILTAHYLELDSVDPTIMRHVINIIKEWIGYELEGTEKNVIAFCCRITPFIKNKSKYKNIIYISDSNLDGIIVKDMIKTFFHEDVDIRLQTDLITLDEHAWEHSLIVIDRNHLLSDEISIFKNTVFVNNPPTKEDLKEIQQKFYDL